jgi:putative DNA primase/helicase
MFSSFSSWCDEDGNFNPALLAKDIVENYEIKTDPASDLLFFYDYDIGIYDRNGDAKLRTVIDSCLGSENRQHRTTETIYLVHSKTQTKIEFSPKIACLNGLLNVKTQTLEAFTPSEFVTVKIPVRYDKNIDCPIANTFLSEILEADQIPIAQEMIGYCLLREYPIHTSFVLLGPGANGKSTFLNLLNAFLGPENCSHATLQQLCEGKFELAQLYGKLANICDDLPGDALKSVGNFKNLTGNAPIMAQFKHKTPFDFLNIAKLFWACNKLPAASEDTIAYYRRFDILQFNKYFLGSKADIKLLEKLITPTELSGLLNYALEGLERLLKQSQFSNSESVEQTRQQYIRTADSCQSFIEETTEIDTSPKAIIPDDVFYEAYVSYCNSHKLPIQKKAQLTISMQRNRPEAKHTVQRIQGKLTHVWQFIKFVTTVTTVTGLPVFSELSNIQIYKKRESLVTPITVVTPDPIPVTTGENSPPEPTVSGIGFPTPEPTVKELTVDERTCGKCVLWHKPGCTFPGSEYTCVALTNMYAVDCRDFMEKERLNQA